MDVLKLVGGLGSLAILIVVVGSLAGLAFALATDAAALATFALVGLVAAAVVSLGIAGRRNAGRDGEPYW